MQPRSNTQLLAKKDDYLQLMRESPDFVRLWLAHMIAMGGDWFTTVAIMALVLELTHSPGKAAIVLICNTLPTFLVSPLTGVLADRLNRKAMIVMSLILSSMMALGFMLVDRPGRVWIAYILTAGLVSLGACILAAASAGVPCLVARRHLVVANALFGAAWGLMLAVGAAAGGFVSGTLGRNAAFQINAVALLLAGILVLTIRRKDFRSPPADRMEDPLPDVVPESEAPPPDVTFEAGIRYLTSNPRMILLMLAKVFWGLGGGILVLLSVFPVEEFKAGDQGVGLLYSFRGVGSLLGPLVALAVVKNQVERMPAAIFWGLISVGLFYMLFSQSPTLGTAAWLILFAHVGAGVVWVMSATMLQLMVPNHLMGRISALDIGGVTLSMALSQYAAGELAEISSSRTVGLACGILTAALGVVWISLWRWFEWRATRKLKEVADDPTLST